MGVNVTRNFVIPVLGLILFFTNSGYSIRCWLCDSSIDPRCGDPFDNSTIPIADCALIYARPPLDSGVKFTMCGKIKYYKGNNRTAFISRGCLQEGNSTAVYSCNSTYYQTNVFGLNSSCSSCSYDLCNSQITSAAPTSSQITSALLVSAIMFITKITIL